MVFVGLASLRVTNPELRAANGFEWEPIREVAYLFAGIFICIIPVMAMLEAGAKGPFSAAIHVLARDRMPDNAVYFWATGVLSSFLDNAPTYLVFFQLAGGDPAALMGPLAKTLTVISLGAVFMGANTYIGNAPNFMVYAIARRAGVNMPGFFSFMIWSGDPFSRLRGGYLAVPDVERDEVVPRGRLITFARSAIGRSDKCANSVNRFLVEQKRRMALTFDGMDLRAGVPAGHFPKRSGRKKIGIRASDDEQRDVAQTIESRPDRGKRLFEIEAFERLHQITIISLANASHRIGEGYSGVSFPIGLA
jgi:hypothetical protein